MAAERVTRPSPWKLLFDVVEPRYPGLGAIPDDPAAFSRHPAVQRLIADVESPGLLARAPTAAAEYQYLLFADARHWHHGRPVRAVGLAGLDAALSTVPPVPTPETTYVQLPPRMFWGRPDPAGPHEPLDGCYVVTLPRGELLVVAILGLHAERAGLSQIALTLPAGALAEAEGALPDPPFAPAMPGGAQAGMRSVTTAAELAHLVRVALAASPP